MPAPVPSPRRTQRERSEATTAELLSAARELFARDGYEATSLDGIATAAAVSKGALYHHFGSKRDVFRAVFAAEQRRLAGLEEAAYRSREDPWDGFIAGCEAFLEASADPGVGRITLRDAPGALGQGEVRELEAGAYAMTRAGLRRAMDAGRISPRPVDPLATLVFGSLCALAEDIAGSKDPRRALRESVAELRRVLGALAA